MRLDDMTKALRPRLSRLRTDEDGAVTVEFVILFPGIVLLLLAMVWFSLVIATLSDVQQLSADLTRQTLRLSFLEQDSDDLCDRLRDDVAPTVMESMHFINPAQVVSVECSIQEEPGLSSVAVTYDMRNFGQSSVGSILGWDKAQVTRRATMVW
jgi:Flp pilus assembly protein TadG